MKNYSKEEISSLIDRFEKRKLPKKEWTHEAHLVVAIWYCKKYQFEKAMNKVRANIKQHNISVGTANTDTGGYHESITKFWLIVASRFIAKCKAETTDAICNAFINSEWGRSSYPLNFYKPKTLFTLKARHHWVEPDLNEI